MDFLWSLAVKKAWWQFVSQFCWNRACPWHASELVSLLVGLRTYQHPDTFSNAACITMVPSSPKTLIHCHSTAVQAWYLCMFKLKAHHHDPCKICVNLAQLTESLHTLLFCSISATDLKMRGISWEIEKILPARKFHYHVHKSLDCSTTLCQYNYFPASHTSSLTFILNFVSTQISISFISHLFKWSLCKN